MLGGSSRGGRAQAQQEVAPGAARPGPAPCAAPLWLRLAAAGGAVRGGPGSRGLWEGVPGGRARCVCSWEKGEREALFTGVLGALPWAPGVLGARCAAQN